MAHAIRVLIVDDSMLTRQLLCRVLSEDPLIEIAGTAPNGKVALRLLGQVSADLMVLDLEMPVLNGLKTLHALRKTHAHLPVVVYSALTERHAETTLDALALGADDYALKPSEANVEASMQTIREILVPKIKALCPWALDPESRKRIEDTPLVPGALIPKARKIREAPPIKIVAIGVSTGGPQALAQIMPGIPADFPVPIMITQHMPPVFTKALADRLAKASKIEVVEGEDGDRLRPGRAWVAPGGRHMVLASKNGNICIATNEEEPVNFCRPSVDVMLRSVASVFGDGTLAVILTGMGQDGFAGCANIRALGGQVVAQDEATSVVWGMPRAVIRAGLAQKVLPLGDVAQEIAALVLRRP